MPPGAKFSKMSKIHVLHLRYNPYFLSKFCRNTYFFPIIDDALSVAILTAGGQSTPTLLSTLTRELKISFAVVVSITGTNPRISSVTDKASSTPRINMAWKTVLENSAFFVNVSLSRYIHFGKRGWAIYWKPKAQIRAWNSSTSNNMSLLRQNTIFFSYFHENYKDVPPVFTPGWPAVDRKLLELVVLINISVYFLKLKIQRCQFRHFL